MTAVTTVTSTTVTTAEDSRGSATPSTTAKAAVTGALRKRLEVYAMTYDNELCLRFI